MPEGSTSSPASGSSPETLRPAWVRLFLPSVSDVLFVGLLAVLVFTPLSVRLLGDAGIGWHIRTGQLILTSYAIPRVDPFSATMHGQPWFAWEWLYDLLVGGLERAAGLNGVVWLTAVAIAAVFAWTFRLLVQRGKSVPVALALVLLAASSSMIHFLTRPHVISWLLTLVWFWILDSSETTGRARLLWLLPLLMLVWVNVHGGFLTGFVLLAIYWASAVWQRLTLRESKFQEFLLKMMAGKRASQLALVGLLSLVATFVNPYGWRLHVHIYNYLSNRFLMDHIDEFQAPNFHGVAQRCFAGLLLITLVALAARARDLRLSEGLIILFAVFSALYAARNIPVSSLLLVLVVGPLLGPGLDRGILGRWNRRRGTRVGREPFFARMGGIEAGLRGHLWAIAAVLATGWIAFHGGHLGSRALMDAHFDSKRFPVQAVDYLEKSGSNAAVLGPDYWGGYLIYRLYPKVLVSVDDRHDLYGEAFLKSYLKLMRVEPGWENFLEEHDIQRALAPKDSGLSNILKLTGRWTIAYSDEVGVVLVRSSGSQASAR
jgi:hypothetical protein